MANKILKEKVLKDRIQNQTSYSELKKKFGVSKSTLSGWLKDYPLSKARIVQLRDRSAQRIESYRNTMRKKNDLKIDQAYKIASKLVGDITKREIFLGGLFLYWAEGGKTENCNTSLTNSNPDMIRFFVRWLKQLGIKKEKLKAKIHIYSDMNLETQLKYWSEVTGLKISQFYKPYIKKSKISSITYKNGFGQGTCCVIYFNRQFKDLVSMGIKKITESIK